MYTEIEMINLMIVSDIRLYREGMGRILGEEPDINVAAISENHNEAIHSLKNRSIDLILLDMRMSNSCQILTSITNDFTHIKIIVIAVPENDDNFLLCAESGITGYLTKESTIEELVDAVKTVAKGNLYCPYSITKYILNCVKHKHDDQQIHDAKINYSNLLNALTQREIQIVKLLADGMSNKAIARTLTIELSTVKNHVHNILVKMGVESRAQVACLLRNNHLASEIDQ